MADVNKLFSFNYKEYEVDRIMKTNKLVKKLTGKSIIEFFDNIYFSNEDEKEILKKVFMNRIDDEVVSFIMGKYNENPEYFNNHRDWRKLDSYMRSVILGWVTEDATIYHLNKNGINAVLNEDNRDIFSHHNFTPDLKIGGLLIEVMTHYYEKIVDDNVFYIKKVKLDLLKNFNSWILLYDVHSTPMFTVLNVNSVRIIREERKLIGGKRGYVIDLSGVKFYKIKKMPGVFRELINDFM